MIPIPKASDFNCLCCADVKLDEPETFSMTEYPILDIFVCPVCGTKHILLHDHVLCTEKDYSERIRHNYKL